MTCDKCSKAATFTMRLVSGEVVARACVEHMSEVRLAYYAGLRSCILCGVGGVRLLDGLCLSCWTEREG